MNLYCYIPEHADATSFYRAVHPLSALRKLIPTLNITHHTSIIKHGDIAHQDVCFIQRPSGEEHLALVKMCKDLKVKVWVDFDDNFFCVPPSNQCYKMYSSQKTQETIAKIIHEADAVSVSTLQLAKDLLRFRKDGDTIEVIPNAFNDYLFPITKETKPQFKPHQVIMWRGGKSHEKDLHTFASAIEKSAKRHPMWNYPFMGYEPWFLLERLGKQAIHVPGVDILTYFNVIKIANPNIAYACLTDIPFNRCKSNISWIENTYAGAVCIGPEFEEWKRPGMVTYSKPEQLSDIIDYLIESGPHELAKQHAYSWEYISDTLMLSRVNEQRKSLLCGLL